MKKITSLFLATLLILCFLGCETKKEMRENLNERITRGTIDGNIYKSEFTGITFTKPDHWRYLTAEEIEEEINYGINSLDANVYEKNAAYYSNIVDMRVVNNTNGTCVTIGYENLSQSLGKSVSEEDYLVAVKESLASSGYVHIGEDEYVKISNESYLKASFLTWIDGVQVEATYYLRLIGDIMTVITVGVPETVTNHNIESLFS
ncbi:MAG: hypothetical protein E7566_01515 [Ruminococcaceae bacterium]|nr:hypothetical protein [Oscillospiraceae bacterium]